MGPLVIHESGQTQMSSLRRWYATSCLAWDGTLDTTMTGLSADCRLTLPVPHRRASDMSRPLCDRLFTFRHVKQARSLLEASDILVD